MKRIKAYLSDLRATALDGWNRFWFQPTDPATLCLIRILTGAMLVYTHLVWSLELEAFLGNDGQLTRSFSQAYHDGFAFSYLYWVNSPEVLWGLHLGGLVVLALFTLGVFTPLTGLLSFLITISYANRASGALYGLDQINGFLAMYLAVGPSGACYSVDACWKRWRNRNAAPADTPRIGANISIRLIQLHLCILYLVAGCGKLRTDAWWDGTAIWSVLANYEYQTADLLWMGRYPLLLDFLTHATIAFELGYVALIWPKVSRPLYLLMAVGVHLTIGLCVGMMTFGLIMIVANMAFLSPRLVRGVVGWFFPEGRVMPPKRTATEEKESTEERTE